MGRRTVMRTAGLKGLALNWAVAKSNGWLDYQTDSIEKGQYWHTKPDKAPFGEKILKTQYKPSTDWAIGGALIEKEKINIKFTDTIIAEWYASLNGNYGSYGETALIAAMLCYVASKLGTEIEIPNKLEQ